MRELIRVIIKQPGLHARFLNTLSFMEYCGAQKIAQAARSLEKSSFLLEHLAEEFRHAHYLRSLAEKTAIAGHVEFDYNNYLSIKSSKALLCDLDRQICLFHKDIKSPLNITEFSYLLTTYAIECRALVFYHIYQEELDQEGIGLSLKSILSEERHHLDCINAQLKTCGISKASCQKAIELESLLYEKWLRAIAHEAMITQT